MTFADILGAFVKLLVIAAPASAIPILLSLTPGKNARERGRTAAIACSVAFSVLAVIALSGELVFRLFGISLQAFKIAGGSYLLLVSLSLLVDSEPVPTVSTAKSATAISDPAITPLGIPIICGPGMISTALLVGSDHPGMVGTLGLIAALFLTFGSLFCMLWLAARYSTALKPFILTLAGRLTGIFMAAVGFLIVLSGIGMFLAKGAAL
jgi:multiple antibiotic resistance protein